MDENLTLTMIAHIQYLMTCLQAVKGTSRVYRRLERIEAYLIRRHNREE